VANNSLVNPTGDIAAEEFGEGESKV